MDLVQINHILANIQYHEEPFPTTPELFDHQWMMFEIISRINMTKWFKDMSNSPLYQNEPNIKAISNYSTIFTNSFENTRQLFMTQAMNNLQNGQPVHVVEGNLYYPLLFKSYESWIKISYYFQRIFSLAEIESYENLLELHTDLGFEKGLKMIRLINIEQGLLEAMEEMREISNEIFDTQMATNEGNQQQYI